MSLSIINKGDLVMCQNPTCSLSVRCWTNLVLQYNEFRCAICRKRKYVHPNSKTLPIGCYTSCLKCSGQFKIMPDTNLSYCFICKKNNPQLNEIIKSNSGLNKIIYWSLQFKNLDDLLTNLSDLKINFRNYEKIDNLHVILEYNDQGKFSYNYTLFSGQSMCIITDNLYVSEKAIVLGIIIPENMKILYRTKIMPHITLYKSGITVHEAGILYSENYHNMDQKIPMDFQLVNMIGLSRNGFGMIYHMHIRVKLLGRIEPVYGQ